MWNGLRRVNASVLQATPAKVICNSRIQRRSAVWEAGFNHYLVKPVDIETLLALVEQLGSVSWEGSKKGKEQREATDPFKELTLDSNPDTSLSLCSLILESWGPTFDSEMPSDDWDTSRRLQRIAPRRPVTSVVLRADQAGLDDLSPLRLNGELKTGSLDGHQRL